MFNLPMLAIANKKNSLIMLVITTVIFSLLFFSVSVLSNVRKVQGQPPTPGTQITNRAVGAGNVTVTLIDTDNGTNIGTYNGDIARFTCDGRRLVIRRLSPSLGVIVVDSVNGNIIGEFAAATNQGLGDFSCAPVVTGSTRQVP